MQSKPIYQKKVGTGLTLSHELLDCIDQRRGDVPRSALVESELRKTLGLAPIKRTQELSDDR